MLVFKVNMSFSELVDMKWMDMYMMLLNNPRYWWLGNGMNQWVTSPATQRGSHFQAPNWRRSVWLFWVSLVVCTLFWPSFIVLNHQTEKLFFFSLIKLIWDVLQVWRVADAPEDDKYQYTYFTHKLNSFDTAPKKLLPSDSRLRPDRYALEKGDLSKAGSEKSRSLSLSLTHTRARTHTHRHTHTHALNLSS